MLVSPLLSSSRSGHSLEDAIMKYRKLGRTGFEVSDIAHGLWGMSGWSGSDDKESLAAMQLGIDQGCNFFDTAWAYGEGKSDGLLGEIMARTSGKRI
jgi:aryl-alcohol dehydrogenase-like predicted oxidoreductase